MSIDNDSPSASADTGFDNDVLAAGTFHIGTFYNFHTALGFR
jgi:hypothetical protein